MGPSDIRFSVLLQLETTGHEVPELAYRLHSQLSGCPRAAATDGHVVYQLTERVAVPLWENRCLLAADTTGLRTWQVVLPRDSGPGRWCYRGTQDLADSVTVGISNWHSVTLPMY